MADDRPRSSRAIIAAYALLGAGWLGVSRFLVPPIIEAAYQGRSLAVLNRFFRGRAPHPLEHYDQLWAAFSGAVLIAGALHLAMVLVVGRMTRRYGEGKFGAGLGGWLIGFSAVFLASTILSGPRHDYVADLGIWDVTLRGLDPWWVTAGQDISLNAYGPLFNLLAGLAWINPLAPKLVFAGAYLGFLVFMASQAGKLPRFGLVAWFLNPFPWVEIAWFGHFDILVALACVSAVHQRVRGRELRSGMSLAAGVLLKYVPLVILPFLALEGRRVRPRVLIVSAGAIALGLGLSFLVWGPSTFRPLRIAATRGSTLLSIFRFLRGVHSPLRLLWAEPDVDFLATPTLALAGGLVFAWCWWRRVDSATSALLAVVVTLLLYRVGFVQYQMIVFLLGSYWAVAPRGPGRDDRLLTLALWIYGGAYAGFDVYYASFGGVVHPEDPWAWVEEWAGLPAFLIGLLLLGSLLRFSNERRSPGESGTF